MMKRMTTMALTAGLTVVLTAGAQAQTINGVNSSNTTLFTVLISPSVTPPPSPFTYTYLLTLQTDPGAVKVNTFDFNFDPTQPVTFVSAPGYSEINNTPGAFQFAANGSGGLSKVGDAATFTFNSPLPPTGTVAVASTAPGQAGGGTSSIGPGPVAVPEASTYALLGLGLLPLALIARRRMANNN